MLIDVFVVTTLMKTNKRIKTLINTDGGLKFWNGKSMLEREEKKIYAGLVKQDKSR